MRGTAQNPDVFFQAREAANPFHDAVPGVVAGGLRRARRRAPAAATALVDYDGAPDAERVVVLMGSGAGAAAEAVDALVAAGERVGAGDGAALPAVPGRRARARPCRRPCTRIAVLDRTKEPGAVGEPLYLDVRRRPRRGDGGRRAAVRGERPAVIGGRYGLSSKEFTPAMVKAVFDELAADRAPARTFTVGIVDDVTHLSLDPSTTTSARPTGEVQALFFGLGSDGTVGANKSSVKIIGEQHRPATPRATSSTTRRSRARSPCRTCASAPSRSARPTSSTAPTSSPATSSACSSEMKVLEHRPPRRHLPAQQPVRAPTRCGTTCRVEVQEQIVDKGIALWVDRRRRRRPRGGHGRPHQHRDAAVLLRRSPACCRPTRPIAAHQGVGRARPTASAGQRRRRAQLRRHRRVARRAAPRSPVPAAVTRHPPTGRRAVPDDAPDFVAAGHRP